MRHESIPVKNEEQSVIEYRNSEKDFDTIRAIEHDEVLQNHENIGYNITDALLISPARMEEAAKAQALIDEFGEDVALAELAEKYDKTVDEVRAGLDAAISGEMAKVETTREFIDQLPDGVSLRVHPYPPNSPFAMQNCRHELDGVSFFSFDPLALEQMRAIYDKCNAGENPGELSVVMNTYTAERGGDIPKTDEEIQEYAKMCITFLDQMGLRESGGAGICLELGNETNVSLDTLNTDGRPMFDKEGFAKTVDPSAYAHMYAKVASMIKEEFPNVELAIAGTALFDDDYLEKVITTITADNGGKTGLIDKISFHPYRSLQEHGTGTFIVDSEGHKQHVESPLDYSEQCDRMAELAVLAGAKRFDVGEVAFVNWGADGRTINTEELHKNSEDCNEKGLKSYIWPGDQIIQFG